MKFTSLKVSLIILLFSLITFSNHVYGLSAYQTADSTITIAAGRQYRASGIKTRLFGEHYRKVWATPVKAKYLNLKSFAGGLTPIKLDLNKQSASLQLEGKDGNIYQFHIINKDISDLLPDELSKTFAKDFFQDQLSTGHPYSALIIPELSRAIGIYYTTPQLVYLARTTALGKFNSEAGGQLGLIEAYPDEDVSDFKSFGNSKNAVTTAELYKLLGEDDKNQVDQYLFLKSRLFDLLIGDWNRGEDNWRWAEFKTPTGSIFRPIPYDREQAFSKYDGLLPGIASLIVRDFQSFGKKIKNPKMLSLASKNLDRNFLNKMTLKDWQKATSEIQTKLTDQVIESAVKRMPPEVYNLSAGEIIARLKVRRDALQTTSEEYYNILVEEVTIAGSNKKENIFVKSDSDSTTVSIYAIENNNTRLNYNRSFSSTETKAVNIYALGSTDSIALEGDGAIKTRIVGGAGDDFILNNLTSSNTTIYDNKKGNAINAGNATTHLSRKDWVNEYDPYGFKYDKNNFFPAADFNYDDGLFVGFGYNKTHYGFKKTPYSYNQNILFRYAPKTGALTLRYLADFRSVLSRNTDILISSLYRGPQYTLNYFGEGNSTTFDDDRINEYRVRTRTLIIGTFIRQRFSDIFEAAIGPGFEYYHVLPSPDRFVTNPAFPEPLQVDKPESFATIRSYTNLDLLDNKKIPKKGFRWRNQANYFTQLSNSSNNHVQLKSDLAVYATTRIKVPVTFAIALGGATNIGSYNFYQANTIGNNTNANLFSRGMNLRGYRDNRFTGRSFIYQNSEFRIPVTDFKNYFLSGSLGFFGFFDAGKVFSDNPESSQWHTGYGPGLWMNFYNLFLISTSLGFSQEGKYLTLKTGMSF